MATTGSARSLAVTVGANLRVARAAAGLTQHELAVAVGAGDSMAISRWERGVNRPSDRNLVALAGVLGRGPAWFFADEETKAAA